MSAQPAATKRRSFARSADDRVLTGVAAGLANRWRVDPLALRAAFVLLSMAGGVGIALYLVALALAEPVPRVATADTNAIDSGRSWATLCFALASLFLARRIGLWVGDALAWPVAMVVIGSSAVWLRRPDAAAEARRVTNAVRRPPQTVRAIAGLLLVAGGVAALSIGVGAAGGLVSGVGAVLVVALGLIVVAGPWVLRAGRELSDERRRRIRGEERAALSAHLHDSVLQTLTLIQRQAGDQEAVVRLARLQEHELRDWLYGGDRAVQATVRQELEDVARSVEEAHGLRIETVYVGDAPLDAATQALTEGTREALVNVAKHAGVPSASLFVETGPTEVVVFVRDRGAGFDPTNVAADRMGIRISLRERMARVGGAVDITSDLGHGTEVELRVPRARTEDAS